MTVKMPMDNRESIKEVQSYIDFLSDYFSRKKIPFLLTYVTLADENYHTAVESNGYAFSDTPPGKVFEVLIDGANDILLHNKEKVKKSDAH